MTVQELIDELQDRVADKSYEIAFSGMGIEFPEEKNELRFLYILNGKVIFVVDSMV